MLIIPAPVLFLLLDLSDADVAEPPDAPLGLEVAMEEADVVEAMELNDGELGSTGVASAESLGLVFPFMMLCDDELCPLLSSVFSPRVSL